MAYSTSYKLSTVALDLINCKIDLYFLRMIAPSIDFRLKHIKRIKRKLKGGGVRPHDYYRCANNYPADDHPSVRWHADDLDDAILADLAKFKMPDDEVAA
jgi:hypothetical protein